MQKRIMGISCLSDKDIAVKHLKISKELKAVTKFDIASNADFATSEVFFMLGNCGIDILYAQDAHVGEKVRFLIDLTFNKECCGKTMQDCIGKHVRCAFADMTLVAIGPADSKEWWSVRDIQDIGGSL